MPSIVTSALLARNQRMQAFKLKKGNHRKVWSWKTPSSVPESWRTKRGKEFRSTVVLMVDRLL
jgi:hypothetical protein